MYISYINTAMEYIIHTSYIVETTYLDSWYMAGTQYMVVFPHHHNYNRNSFNRPLRS